jgi:hypothetical protein
MVGIACAQLIQSSVVRSFHNFRDALLVDCGGVVIHSRVWPGLSSGGLRGELKPIFSQTPSSKPTRNWDHVPPRLRPCPKLYYEILQLAEPRPQLQTCAQIPTTSQLPHQFALRRHSDATPGPVRVQPGSSPGPVRASPTYPELSNKERESLRKPPGRRCATLETAKPPSLVDSSCKLCGPSPSGSLTLLSCYHRYHRRLSHVDQNRRS